MEYNLKSKPDGGGSDDQIQAPCLAILSDLIFFFLSITARSARDFFNRVAANSSSASTPSSSLAPGRQHSPPGMDSPPSQPALLALTLVLLLALYLARRRRAAGKNRKYPPVAGTVLHQLFNFGRLVEYQTELARRHRTFRMLTPTSNYIYTVEPGNIEYILKTNFANYGKGSALHELAEDLLGDGIFNVDGAKWRHQRKVASHEFSTRVLRDYSSAVFGDTGPVRFSL
uniref:Cytochrome P450 n=1 Tax=Setaria viridis TaxID=4556 RepID=A0A4U6TTN6_SETVI|nr:hypothetical protein SEVIR_7G218250v2 [Setaria viridis]